MPWRQFEQQWLRREQWLQRLEQRRLRRVLWQQELEQQRLRRLQQRLFIGMYSAAVSACEKVQLQHWQWRLQQQLQRQRHLLRRPRLRNSAAVSARETGCITHGRGRGGPQREFCEVVGSLAACACEKGGQRSRHWGLLAALTPERVQLRRLRRVQWLQRLEQMRLRHRQQLRFIGTHSAAVSACEKVQMQHWQWRLQRWLLRLRHWQRRQRLRHRAAVSACEMGGIWLQCGRAPRDTVTYGAAVSACEKAGEWLEAMELFAEMACDSAEQDTISYSAAINACAIGS